MHDKHPQADGSVTNKKVVQDITFDGPTVTGAIQCSPFGDDIEKQLNDSQERPTDQAVANEDELLVRILFRSRKSHLNPFVGEV